MKERFLREGLDGMSDHEVLELILFYARPRVNTNVIAHELLHRFGSLSGVMEADREELVTVDGVGENSALMIKLMTLVFRRYEMDRRKDKRRFVSLDSVGKYLVNYYIGASREKVIVMLLDPMQRLIDVVTLHEGAVTSSDINPDKLADTVFRNRASSFILAHNHPGGSVEPSVSDMLLTYEIFNAFKGFSVKFREHIIVSGDLFRGILSESLAYAGERPR